METRIGFGRRLGAYVIDISFIVGIAYILFSLFGDFFERFVDFAEINDAQFCAVGEDIVVCSYRGSTGSYKNNGGKKFNRVNSI